MGRFLTGMAVCSLAIYIAGLWGAVCFLLGATTEIVIRTCEDINGERG